MARRCLDQRGRYRDQPLGGEMLEEERSTTPTERPPKCEGPCQGQPAYQHMPGPAGDGVAC